MGEQAMVYAARVAALFAGITRIVDATGLPEDPPETYATMEFVLKRLLPGAAVAIGASCIALMVTYMSR